MAAGMGMLMDAAMQCTLLMAAACAVCRYRTVARNSHVDDSLFGSSKRAPAGEAGKAAAQDAATLKAAQVVTVRASDLQRMLGDAVTAEQVSSLRRAEEERKEQERAASKARKLKMLQLAQEAQQQVREHLASTAAHLHNHT